MSKPRIKVRSHRTTIVDYDYLEKLDGNQLQWLQTFSDEYYSGYFHKSKSPIHPTGLRKDCFNRNSKINRDLNNQNTPRSIEILGQDEILSTEASPEPQIMLKAQYGSLIEWIQSPHGNPMKGCAKDGSKDR